MRQAHGRTRRAGGARRAPLLALAVLVLVVAPSALVTIPAQASVPRAVASDVLAVASLGDSGAPAAALDVVSLRSLTDELAPTALAVPTRLHFAGDELALAASARERRLHALQDVSLLSAESRRGPRPSFPETRIGVFEFLGAPLVGVERGLSLELRWGSRFSCFRTVAGSVRFGQEDPAGTGDSLNRYQAFRGAWTGWTDPSGLWPTKYGFYVHQAAIDGTLGNVLSEHDLRILRDAQVLADADQVHQYKHAMRLPGQTIQEARVQANNFLQQEMTHAIKYERGRTHDRALLHLGLAIHVVQDATSPVHRGFQMWDPAWDAASEQARQHVLGENFDPGENSELYLDTYRTYTVFANAVGQRVPSNPLSLINATAVWLSDTKVEFR